MNSHELQAYHPSGKLSVSLLWFLIFLSAAIIGIAFLSSQLIAKFPFIFVAMLLFLVSLFVVGICAKLLIRWSKIRNTGVGFIVGLWLGLVSWLSSWLFLFPEMLSRHQINLTWFELLNRPELVAQHIHLVVATGYQMMDYTIKGSLLQTVWLIELAGLVIYPAYKGFETAKNRVFCESCGQWAEDQGGMLAFHYQDESVLADDFKKGSFKFMDSAEAIYNVPMKDYYQINSEVCVACNDLFALSLLKMKKATDLDKPKPRAIYEKLLVKRPHFQHFLMLRSQFPAPEES